MRLTRQMLVLALVAVLLGVGARCIQKDPVPLWGYPKIIELIQPKVAMAGADAVSPDSAFVPAEQAYQIDLSSAMGLFMKRKKSNVHFVDARDAKLYGEGHIPGAVNIPFERIGSHAEALNRLPKKDLIVLYCDGGDCHLSHDLAEHMLGQGWRRLAVFAGGWAEWLAETDFVEKSE